MTNDQLKHAAIVAIEALFYDKSVTIDEAKDGLQELIDMIDDLMNSLDNSEEDENDD